MLCGRRNRIRSVTACGIFFLSGCARTDGGQVEAECSNGVGAALDLGEAVAGVKAARQFAEASDRRLALARLESLLVRQIQAEPDTMARNGAWLLVDMGVPLEMAEQERRRVEARASRMPDGEMRDEFLRDAFTLRYRERMSSVVFSLDPRTPHECAQPAWQALYEAALDAEAR